MPEIQELITKMRHNPKGISFKDLCVFCDSLFGEARQKSSSHRIYKPPWQGDPRGNIQKHKGMAKAYQVRQVLKSIEHLEAQNDVKE